MKYLKLFSSESDYQSAKDNLDKPNVAYVDGGEVYFADTVAPSSPTFTGFRGCGATTSEALTIDERPIEDTLDTGYVSGQDSFVAVSGSNLQAIQASKLASNDSNVNGLRVLTEGNNYFISFYVEYRFSDSVEISYDGNLIFQIDSKY